MSLIPETGQSIKSDWVLVDPSDETNKVEHTTLDDLERIQTAPISESLNMKPITSTEVKRVMFRKGEQGQFVVRLCEGWKTSPYFTESGLLTGSARCELRLKNIELFRGDISDPSLGKIMVGPNHYFGTLIDIDKHAYQISIEQGFPTFSATEYCGSELGRDKALTELKPTEQLELGMGQWCWASGTSKEHTLKEFLKDKITARSTAASLTAHLGVLILPSNHLEMPKLDATAVNLSEYGAKLVRNDQPFTISQSKEDAMDVVTYHFGKQYAQYQIEHGNGLFLETHDFTQIMTPLSPSCGGFITLGKKVQSESEGKKLQLIGVRVPYGYSIIVEKGAVHGDATFTGSYAMAMTVLHTTMGTADVVFLRDSEGKNVTLSCPESDQQNQEIETETTAKNLTPWLFPKNGPLKQELSKSAQANIESIPRKGSVLAVTVFNPSNKAWWKQFSATRLIG